MKVFSVDPGVTTGVSHYDLANKRVLAYGEMKSPLSVVRYLHQLWMTDAVDFVVVEDFVGSGPRDRNIIFTIKALGLVEGYAKFLGIETTLQAPQTRKAFLDDAIKLLGNGRHFIDALAHSLAFAYYNQERVKQYVEAMSVLQSEIPREPRKVGASHRRVLGQQK